MKQIDDLSVLVKVTVTNYGLISSYTDEVKLVMQEGDMSSYNGKVVVQYPRLIPIGFFFLKKFRYSLPVIASGATYVFSTTWVPSAKFGGYFYALSLLSIDGSISNIVALPLYLF